MACELCERSRQLMKAAILKGMEHTARLAGLRKGGTDAPQPADVPAIEAQHTPAPAEGSEPAGNPGAAHGKLRLAKDPGAGPGKGRPSVPSVRKAGGGKAGAR